jgi:hypothetical protein
MSENRDYTEFDKLHQKWLTRPDLEISALLCLAHRYSPGQFGKLADPDAQPHYRALKALIRRKLLVHDGGDVNWLTVITLVELLECLERDEVASDPYYGFLRDFAQRWRQYCVAPAIKADGARKPKRRYDIQEVTRRYRDERSTLKPFPTLTADHKWFKLNYPGLPRSTWRDTIRAQIAPDAGRKPGPRAKVTR